MWSQGWKGRYQGREDSGEGGGGGREDRGREKKVGERN